MKQVTAVLVGAGLRGSEAYASYALKYPNELKFVAVAEPDEIRRTGFAEKHHIEDKRQYKDYGELLAAGKIADCALVCTQDYMHFEPVIKLLEMGYHVLCEKPMSPNMQETIEMGNMAEKYNRILSICHVLRYSPFFVQVKKLLEAGKIGKLISIQHIEEVGYWHHAHSFVRGNWRKAEESSPMILAKCCHDMDILRWLVDSPCESVSSYGDLTYFKEENAPEDAPMYCMEGCKNRDTCPYYAPRFYLEHERALKDNLTRAVSYDTDKEIVLEKLRTSPYGRCVFHCDNTVVDHQVVNLKFENGVDASFEMCAFTHDCKRKINLMGTHGQLIGDMEESQIILYDFVTGNKEILQLHTPKEGHSGSDVAMMKAFVELVVADGEMVGRTSALMSVESHLMAMAAEKSRLEKKVIEMKRYREELNRG